MAVFGNDYIHEITLGNCNIFHKRLSGRYKLFVQSIKKNWTSSLKYQKLSLNCGILVKLSTAHPATHHLTLPITSVQSVLVVNTLLKTLTTFIKLIEGRTHVELMLNSLPATHTTKHPTHFQILFISGQSTVPLQLIVYTIKGSPRRLMNWVNLNLI